MNKHSFIAVKFAIALWTLDFFSRKFFQYDFNGFELAKLIFLVLVINYFVSSVAFQPLENVSPKIDLVLLIFWTYLLSRRFIFFVQCLNSPNLTDISFTSMRAITTLLHGQNPYSAVIDYHADFARPPHMFQGYKYLPITLLVYTPLSSIYGLQGILVTNFFFDMAIAFLLLSQRPTLASRTVAIFSSVLYLWLNFVGHKIYRQGSNDVIPIAFALASFLMLDSRLFLSGILLGLSTCSKLIPGALLLVIWGSNYPKRNLFLGFLLGISPALPFFLSQPSAFTENIFLFLILRSYGSIHSWYSHLSPMVPMLLKISFSALLVWSCVQRYRNPQNQVVLCAATVAFLNYLLLTTAVAANYFVWWYPFFAILAARATFSQTSRTTATLLGA